MTHPNAPSTERLREILARPRMSHDAMATNDEIFAVVTELLATRPALRECQEALASMIRPDPIRDARVLITFATATAAEAHARRAINGGSDAE